MTPLVILSENRPDEDSLIEDKACVNTIDSATMARYGYPETTLGVKENRLRCCLWKTTTMRWRSAGAHLKLRSNYVRYASSPPATSCVQLQLQLERWYSVELVSRTI